ncbi:acetyl-CoA C-acyltransferase [Oerskovia enterophila]|uniref:Probable acetyl-CoA acetyltransferase n=1 Tax=Oerskovia enterophila TaxID=43678 RepID=A0ABX2Y6C6_9CELL|nr:acetyl-CoA C-acyltransferase [Oerskovia enterophila]OCI32127.1 putative acetyl-CoA acetyltransferase [Oerskovia enterophila]
MTVIVGYARTPFVRFNGAFATVPAATLGAHALGAALADAGLVPDDVELVLAGQVLQGGAGQNPARQAAVGAGVPYSVPAMTLNAVCLSGMEAVVQAHRLITAGEAQVVVAVGQESMSLAPHAWVGSRAGRKLGDVTLVDTLAHDGLRDAFERDSMGLSTERHGEGLGISRAAQDAFAASSHARAAAAADFLRGEIAPFQTPGRGGRLVEADDGVRVDTTAEVLARLRPAFREDGTITAGNASQISDGAAALVLVSDEEAERRGLTGARILGHALVAGPDVSLHAQPANAIRAASARAGLEVGELSAIEINEAFAVVALASTDLLGVDPAIVDANGGAIALGHPIGASGARIVGHLARRLAALGGDAVGAAALCGGGGQGSAVVLQG